MRGIVCVIRQILSLLSLVSPSGRLSLCPLHPDLMMLQQKHHSG